MVYPLSTLTLVFIQRSEQVHIQDFYPVRPVEPFDKHILRRLTRFDKFQCHTMLFSPLRKCQRDQFLAVVHPQFQRIPRFATILSSTLTTRCARIFRSIPIARVLRLQSSTTLKVRKLLPQTSASCIKSTDQLWLSASGVTSGAGVRTGRRCFSLR